MTGSPRDSDDALYAAHCDAQHSADDDNDSDDGDLESLEATMAEQQAMHAVEYGWDRWHSDELRVVVLAASGPEQAVRRARKNLTDAGFHGYVIGAVRVATQADLDRADADARECSICRRKHGYEVVHACE